MFLSRVIPTTGFALSRLAQQAHSGDAYAQHQLLWQMFPGDEDRTFLFRFEQSRQGPCYYVLSREEPDTSIEGVDVSTKPFQPQLRNGDKLAYTLRANPTRMLKAESGNRGTRVDVLMHAKYQAREDPQADVGALQEQAARDWLTAPERQQRLGVKFVTDPEVSEHWQHQVHKPKGKTARTGPIKFTSVNYQGVLQVMEPAQFIEQLTQGIGRSKAMGCGLMMIRRC